jgi:hypothetical protein
MKNHFKRLGALYIVFGLLSCIIALIFLNTVDNRAPASGAMSFITSIPGFRSVLVFLFMASSLPGIIAGIGLLRRQAWATTMAQILGFIYLVNIPLGTLVGVYTIWAIMNDDAESEAESGAG